MKVIDFYTASQVVSYNPQNGKFLWLVSRGRCAAGSSAGNLNPLGYIAIQICGRRFYAHRLAWLLYYGAMPIGEIDHINGSRSDNRISNLRDVPRAINQQNRRSAQKNNIIGALGVSKCRDMFGAFIKIGGRSTNLGSFETIDDASSAYLAAKRKFHPGSTL